jgi:glycosyltransferase involved in cell wall biosynthesis
MMKISIITPYYYGGKYMKQYMDDIRANEARLATGDELEVILVNDSPDEEIVLPSASIGELQVRILTQGKNAGIHSARVFGLQHAGGDYILFLDQDDRLAENAIARHAENIRTWQERLVVSVSNAWLEQADGSRQLWYRSAYHKQQVSVYRTYLTVGTQIISPGQCLIPRALIPELWKQKLCQSSGADDYYLWLLLLWQGIPFSLVDEPLYTHTYTGRNLSEDTRTTDASIYEFLDYFREEQVLERADRRLLKRMISYKADFREANWGRKGILSLKNPDLFLANLIFKLRSGTPYGFNRP